MAKFTDSAARAITRSFMSQKEKAAFRVNYNNVVKLIKESDKIWIENRLPEQR